MSPENRKRKSGSLEKGTALKFMKSDNKNKIGAKHASPFSKIEKIHPVKMLLLLCLGGVAVLFIMLLLAYARTEATDLQKAQVSFPRFFSVSTILIIFSSYTISRAPKYYGKDKVAKLCRYLGFSLVLSLLFISSQMFGWYELADKGIYFKGKPFGSYLYLITALHVLHLTAGILFLIYFYFKALYASRDAIRTLFFIRDPYRKLQLSLLTTYWHFLGGLWIGLYFVFLFMI